MKTKPHRIEMLPSQAGRVWEEKDQQVNRGRCFPVADAERDLVQRVRWSRGLSLKSGLWVDNPELLATGAEPTPLVQEVVLQADHTAGGPRPHLLPRELSA